MSKWKSKRKSIRLQDIGEPTNIKKSKLTTQRVLMTGKQFAKMMRRSPGVLAHLAVIKKMSIQNQVFATILAEDVQAHSIIEKTKHELLKLLGSKTKAKFKKVD